MVKINSTSGLTDITSPGSDTTMMASLVKIRGKLRPVERLTRFA